MDDLVTLIDEVLTVQDKAKNLGVRYRIGDFLPCVKALEDFKPNDVLVINKENKAKKIIMSECTSEDVMGWCLYFVNKGEFFPALIGPHSGFLEFDEVLEGECLPAEAIDSKKGEE